MSSQGGKRKGAGRKPRSSPRKAVTVRLETEVCEKFQALRIANERSESAQFAEMVKRARLPQNHFYSENVEQTCGESSDSAETPNLPTQ